MRRTLALCVLLSFAPIGAFAHEDSLFGFDCTVEERESSKKGPIECVVEGEFDASGLETGGAAVLEATCEDGYVIQDDSATPFFVPDDDLLVSADVPHIDPKRSKSAALFIKHFDFTSGSFDAIFYINPQQPGSRQFAGHCEVSRVEAAR